MVENAPDAIGGSLSVREALNNFLNRTNISLSSSTPILGSAVTAYPYNRKTVFIKADARGGTATINVEASENKTDWVVLSGTQLVAAQTAIMFNINDHHRFLRTVNTAVTNVATVSTIITGKGV